jgi:hypothetical protein
VNEVYLEVEITVALGMEFEGFEPLDALEALDVLEALVETLVVDVLLAKTVTLQCVRFNVNRKMYVRPPVVASEVPTPKPGVNVLLCYQTK